MLGKVPNIKYLHRYYFMSKNFSVARKDVLDKIIANTKITTEHLTPEIKLRLITPECKIYHEPYIELIFENDPFWGFYWPGGQALSRYIFDNPHIFRNKTVLDIGSGNGATAIAAKKSGAKNVIANDIDPVACIAAEVNSKLNNVQLTFCEENLIGKNCDEDIIMLGDMFYDYEFCETLMKWLKNLTSHDKLILIGDPGRHGLTIQNLKLLKKLKVYELEEKSLFENNGFSSAAVYKYFSTNSKP